MRCRGHGIARASEMVEAQGVDRNENDARRRAAIAGGESEAEPPGQQVEGHRTGARHREDRAARRRRAEDDRSCPFMRLPKGAWNACCGSGTPISLQAETRSTPDRLGGAGGRAVSSSHVDAAAPPGAPGALTCRRRAAGGARSRRAPGSAPAGRALASRRRSRSGVAGSRRPNSVDLLAQIRHVDVHRRHGAVREVERQTACGGAEPGGD